VVPVCFARLGERLFVPIDAKPKQGDPRGLKRLRNLRERSEAVLLLDHYEEDWQRLRWLSIRGQASILENEPERVVALTALEGRYPQYGEMGLSSLGLPVIALLPVTLSRWDGSG
jgi:PPOX class probable F420-dependent enzyme